MPSKINMIFSLTPTTTTPTPASTTTTTTTTTTTIQPKISSRFSMYDLKQVTKGCKSCGS